MNRKLAKTFARELRKESTKSEIELWSHLRAKRFLRLKFYRQYPFHYVFENKKKFFIMDLYCHEHRLCIELDGGYHADIIDADAIRDQILITEGITTLRSDNTKLLRTERILKTISLHCQK